MPYLLLVSDLAAERSTEARSQVILVIASERTEDPGRTYGDGNLPLISPALLYS